MNGEERQNTGCWLAAFVGCGFVAILAVVAGLAAFVVFFRVHAPGPSPLPAVTVTAVPTPAETEPSPPATPDDPDLHLETKQMPYTISGTNADELRRQMNSLGPADDGTHHDAFTHWYVHWSYPYDRSASSCGLGHVKVDLTVEYKMPDWSAPPGAPPDLVSNWSRYRAALQHHEDGHRDNGVAAARDVLAKLRGFGTRTSCDDANKDANDEAHRIVDQYKQKDVDYDKTTRHGATQGATFP